MSATVLPARPAVAPTSGLHAKAGTALVLPGTAGRSGSTRRAEAYLRARGALPRLAVAGALVASAAAMALGIFGAARVLWLPRL